MFSPRSLSQPSGAGGARDIKCGTDTNNLSRRKRQEHPGCRHGKSVELDEVEEYCVVVLWIILIVLCC